MKLLPLAVLVALLGALGYLVLSPSTATQDTLDYNSLPPWPVFRAVNFITRKLDELKRRLVPPVFLVLEDGLSLMHFSAIYVASKLNIPEILHDGPLPVAEIAKKAGAEPRSVFRILRELQTRGIFRQLPHPKGETAYDQQLFENTPSSDVLRADHPWSVKALYQHFKEEMLPAQVHFKDAVVDSSVEPITLALGAPIWEYFKQNPVQSEQFDRAMIATGGLGTPAVVQDYPWDKRCTKVVDIGGGAGGLLSSILKAYPTLTGTVFDLPGPIQSGRKVWSEKFPDLQSRVQFKEGDFFDASTIPSDSDCYVMKFILHDWNDADSIKILKNIAARMPSGARILEAGFHQHEPETMTARALMDLNMLNIHGRERTVSDFKNEILPSVPELKFTEFVETRSPLGIVEFQKK